jgi:hypothetical protein
MEPGQRTTVYYRAEVNGRVMLVDSLDRLPPEARAGAERIALGTSVEPSQSPEQAEPLPTRAPESTQPVAAAPSAKPVQLPAVAQEAEATSDAAATARTPAGFQFDVASFGLGLVSGLIVATLLALSRRSASQGGVWRWGLRSALVACVVMIAAGGYFGWVRRFAGVGSEGLVGPGRLVQDAKDVVEQAQKRREEQLKELEEAQKLAK